MYYGVLMSSEAIIGAFSEEQVSRLTGLSRAQLSGWRRSGFVDPSYRSGAKPRAAYSFVYSFKDLLKLRVLNRLRNVHAVTVQELRKVALELENIGINDWSSKRLWVANRKVVFEEPESKKKREVSSKQFVAEIALEVVTSSAREDIKRMNERDNSKVGQVEKRRQVASSMEVFAGTRIPVDVVMQYLKVGKSNGEILTDYPDLTVEDIKLARSYLNEQAA